MHSALLQQTIMDAPDMLTLTAGLEQEHNLESQSCEPSEYCSIVPTWMFCHLLVQERSKTSRFV